MKPILVLYATREGQTCKIAEHIGSHLAARGVDAVVEDVEDWIEGIDSGRYQAVILAASVHLGRHAREMISFVEKHRLELERLPTAFLSVSLAAAAAEDARQSGALHPRTSAEIEQATRDFLERTGFHPGRILPVAGALLYTRYGRLVRFMMQRIAQGAGLDTDTSRDFEYTEWARLDRFVDDFLRLSPAVSAQEPAFAH